LSTLDNFFNAMFRLEYINRKPISPKITINEKAPKWAAREVQDKIISLISEADRDIFYFLTRQGLRPAEARALKIKDLNFDVSTVLVQRSFSAGVLIERTKTKKESYRLINPELLPMLKRLCRNRFPDEFVFINPRTKKPYCDKTLNNIWNEACKNAAVEIELYNATRHSVASQASSNGAPLQCIKAALGHSDIRTTLRYAMNDLASQSIVFEKINKPIVVKLSSNRNQKKK
jgi:integrase